MDQQTLNFFAYIGALIAGMVITYRQAKVSVQKTTAETAANQNATIQSMQISMDDYDKRIIRAHDRYEALEIQYEDAKKRITQLETEAKNAAITEANLRGQVDILSKQIENGQREASLQHAREEVLKSDLKRMQDELDKLKREVYALSQANDALAKGKMEAENREKVLIEHAKSLEAKLAGVQVERDELLKRVEQLEAKVKALMPPDPTEPSAPETTI